MQQERLASRGSLPSESTSFVGREAELAQLEEYLRGARLVTLTGPGGVGKTRTAVHHGHAHETAYRDGVVLVPLSALTEPQLLPNTVAEALDLPEQVTTPLESVCTYLSDRQTLLVLDTCEHLVDACAELVEVLLAAAPGLSVLATSRQPLDVSGEFVLPLPPLGVPSDFADGPGGAQELASNEALRLFADRASAAVPGFAVTDDNRADLVQLCRRLDGIPLAIELAVSRLRALSPEEMVRRLDSRFKMLSGGRRASVPRHQTLRTTIEWSHELCTEEERRLWARLSVFPGSFSLDAVEAVCSDDRDLPAYEVLDSLIFLVDKSVVQRMDSGYGTRYRMLDTIREFGAELLEARGDTRVFRSRHRDYFLALAERFEQEWTGDDQLARLAEIGEDLPSYHVAMQFSLDTEGEADSALDIATMLWGYWYCACRFAQGRMWLQRCLKHCLAPSPRRAFALTLTSWFTDVQGERDGNWALLEEARRIAELIGDDRSLGWALMFLAHTRGYRGQVEGCLEDLADARRLLAEAGSRTDLLLLGYQSGFMNFLCGNAAEAVACCDEGLLLTADTQAECWGRGWNLAVRGYALWHKGDPAQSAASSREGLRAHASLRDQKGMAFCLENLAWHAAELRHFERVAVLQGAADTLWRRAAAPCLGIRLLLDLHEEAADKAREALGADGYHRSFQEGAVLSFDGLVGLALDEDAPATPEVPSATRGPAEGLTPRERQVAGMAASGMTNRQIAEKLVISQRTVDSHIERSLAKLGISSRSQLAGLLHEDAPVEQAGPLGGGGAP